MTTPLRYEIQEKLGQGGTGIVYRAFDHQLQRAVAVKRLAPMNAGVDGGEGPILREALALSALQHPNIVTLYDLGRDQTGPFVVMELLVGRPLDEVVEEAPLPLAEFSILVRDCLQGLAAAHSQHLLHRDLKPSNLMMVWLPTGEIQIKLLDFGIAKFSQHPTEQTADSGGAIMGSIHYMAPEQFERAPLDARSDLYSLGCVFYHALTREHPFSGETAAQVMAAHLHHELVPVETLRPDLSPALVGWLNSLLQRLPSDRPASATQAWVLYQSAASESSPGPSVKAAPRVVMPRKNAALPATSQTKATSATQPSPASRSIPLTAGLILCILLAGLAYVWSTRSQQIAAPSARSTPSTVQAPAVAAPVSIANKVNSDDSAPYSPFDLPQLRSLIGEEIEVTGEPVAFGQSKSGKTLYLNFSRRPGESASLSFRAGGGGDVFRQETLSPFVGKQIRVRARVTVQNGDLLLSVGQDPLAVRLEQP